MGKEECLENCQGTIMNLERFPNSVIDEEWFNQFIEDYETYHDPIDTYRTTQWFVNCLEKGGESSQKLID